MQSSKPLPLALGERRREVFSCCISGSECFKCMNFYLLYVNLAFRLSQFS